MYWPKFSGMESMKSAPLSHRDKFPALFVFAEAAQIAADTNKAVAQLLMSALLLVGA
jgi:hypothetical protein